jgi:hypothetical protein
MGRDELHQHALAVRGLAAEGFGPAQYFGHHGLPGCGREAQVDETGARNLHGLHMTPRRLAAGQCLDQRLRHFAGVLLQRPGQLHGGGDGQVAVGGLLGRLEGGGNRRAGADFFDRFGERRKKLLFRLDHRADSTVDPLPAAALREPVSPGIGWSKKRTLCQVRRGSAGLHGFQAPL